MLALPLLPPTEWMFECPAPIILEQIRKLNLLDWPISKRVEHVFRTHLATILRKCCILESRGAACSFKHVANTWNFVYRLRFSLSIWRSSAHSRSRTWSLDHLIERKFARVSGLFFFFFQSLGLIWRHRIRFGVFSLHRLDLARAFSRSLLRVCGAASTNACSKTLLQTWLALLEFYFVVLEVGKILGHRHRHRHFRSDFLCHFSLFRLQTRFWIWLLWYRRRLLIFTRSIHRRYFSWVCLLTRLCRIGGEGRLILLRWVKVVRGKAAQRWAFEAWLWDIGCRHLWIPSQGVCCVLISSFGQELRSLAILIRSR